MKWIFHFSLLCHITVFVVNCKFLPLLKLLDMSNPVIVGQVAELKSNEMLSFMKNVMKLNQTISLTTKVRNESLQETSVIIIKPHTDIIWGLYGQNDLANIRKPWIIVDKKVIKYSRIDEPLYSLDNGTLWEHYELKSMRKSNALASFHGNEIMWNSNLPKNFLERRGNFENITLLGMTETELTFNQLPNDLQNVANISEKMPNAYDVRTCIIKWVRNSYYLVDSLLI